MAREQLEQVYNPGHLPVQVHTPRGVIRVPPRQRVVVATATGPTGDHLRSLQAAGILRSEGTVDPPAKPAAPQRRARKSSGSTHGRRAVASRSTAAKNQPAARKRASKKRTS